MSLRLGSLDVRQVRFAAPAIGAWMADCDIDLASDQPVPSGKQTLIVGTQSLVGTVIPQGTARFGEAVRVRLLAGAAAWSMLIAPAHFHNDAPAGVLSSTVLSATAGAIGETVNDPTPVSYGVDFERVGDARYGGLAPASRVLEGRAWHVDATGITQIAPWPPLPMGVDADVLEFDPESRVAMMSADEIVWPGTTLTDVRFGTVTVCEVDQTFTDKGSRVTAYCATSLVDRMGAAFASVEDPSFERVYLYRVSTQGADGRVTLQAVTKVSGIPDTLPISLWTGVPGITPKFSLGSGLGSMVAVAFLNGDRTQPRVLSFDGTKALNIDLAATLMASITAPTVQLGDSSAAPIVLADPMLQILAAIGTEITADIALLSNPPTSITFAAYAPAKLALLNTLFAAILAELVLLPTLKVRAS